MVTTALYADDTKIFNCISSEEGTLLNMKHWSKVNNVYFNASKCKAISVTRKSKPLCYSYNLAGVHPTRVAEEKDLGVTITNSLSWDTHIHNIVAKANNLFGILKRTCPLLTDLNVRRTLYLSLVSPISWATPLKCCPQTSIRWRRRLSVFKGEPHDGFFRPGWTKCHIRKDLSCWTFCPLFWTGNLRIYFTTNASLVLVTLMFLSIHRLFLTAVPDKVILSILKVIFAEPVLVRLPILIVLLSWGILFVRLSPLVVSLVRNLLSSLFTAISRKVVGKMFTRQSRKVIWDMINVLFLTLQKSSLLVLLSLPQHSQTYVHGPSCHSFKFLWRTGN